MKKYVLFAFLSAAFCFALGANYSETARGEDIKENAIRFSASAFNGGGYGKTATVSGDGKTLKLQSFVKTYGQLLFSSKEGFFKGNTEYKITFNYKIDSLDPAAALKFYMRDSDAASGKNDIVNVDFPAQKDFVGEYTLRFKTPANAKKLTLRFLSVNCELTASITNMVISQGAFEAFIPFNKTTEKPFEGEFDNLPTGAVDFEVDKPKGDGSVVGAEKYGIEPDVHAFVSKLNAAIKDCKNKDISKLILPKGTYYIIEDEPLEFNGLKDFEFDGGGSTLVFNKRKDRCVAIKNCERVKIHNFNIDWDWDKDPLGSFVKVVGAKSIGEEYFVDFNFVDYTEYPQRFPRIAFLSSVDEKTRSVGVEGGKSIPLEMWKNSIARDKKWLTPNTLRVNVPLGVFDDLQRGQMYRMNHYYYDMGGFYLGSNTHLALENINVYSCPGMAFTVEGKDSYWSFKNVNVKFPEGTTKRAVTCTADHIHIARSKGFFKMENCEIGFGADDCINAHDVSGLAKSAEEKSIALPRNANHWSYANGDVLEFRNLDLSPTGFSAKIVKKVVPEDTELPFELILDEKVPEEFKEMLVFNRAYDTRNIIIKNCEFKQNRARGVLILARDVTIENCKFYRNEMGAIKFESGYTLNSWCEGYGVDNVVVRNCEFDTVNPAGIPDEGKSRDIFFGSYLKTDPSDEKTDYPIVQNVLFENNTFKNTFGLVAFISSSNNIIFRGNTMINTDARKSEMPYRGGFFVKNSRNVKLVNNSYLISPLVKNTGVWYDSSTTENIIATGNVFVKELKSIKEETQKNLIDDIDISSLPSFSF